MGKILSILPLGRVTSSLWILSSLILALRLELMSVPGRDAVLPGLELSRSTLWFRDVLPLKPKFDWVSSIMVDWTVERQQLEDEEKSQELDKDWCVLSLHFSFYKELLFRANQPCILQDMFYGHVLTCVYSIYVRTSFKNVSHMETDKSTSSRSKVSQSPDFPCLFLPHCWRQNLSMMPIGLNMFLIESIEK